MDGMKLRLRGYNNGSVVQGDDGFGAPPDLFAERFPLWAAGLNGKGEWQSGRELQEGSKRGQGAHPKGANLSVEAAVFHPETGPLGLKGWFHQPKSSVVGIGDSGLDIGSCYFRDQSAAGGRKIPGEGHRKIVGYRYWCVNLMTSRVHTTDLTTPRV
eukprot:9504137-Pyramimonas_sp.AAC.2